MCRIGLPISWNSSIKGKKIISSKILSKIKASFSTVPSSKIKLMHIFPKKNHLPIYFQINLSILINIVVSLLPDKNQRFNYKDNQRDIFNIQSFKN